MVDQEEERLRPGEIADIAAITRVRTSVRENHLSVAQMAERGITPDSVAEMMRAAPCCWVALEAGAVVGFAMVDHDSGGVFACFVDPAHEGRGHGGRLLRAAEAALWPAHERIWLETGAATRAAGFYRARGWRDAGPAEGDQIRLEKPRPRALLVIDMQAEMARRLAAGVDCVNPAAPARVAELVAGFRAAGLPVLHVRHRGGPGSAFHPTAPGFAPMPCADALPGEAVFEKTTSSAFASTALEAHLRAAGLAELVVCGAVAGFCVSSTVRAAADLGFRVTLAEDAVLGFGLPGLAAAQVFAVSMGLLAADFAHLAQSADLRP